MSDRTGRPPQPRIEPAPSDSDPGQEPSSGPSLPLLYSLIALALAFAIGFALLIVMPFHHRH